MKMPSTDGNPRRRPSIGREPSASMVIVRAIYAFVPRASASIVTICALSVLTAVGEAAVLVVMVRIAAALAAGNAEAVLSVGPVAWPALPLEVVAVAGIGLLLLLMTATVLTAVVSSRLSARAVAQGRTDLVRAYLAARWSIQAGERPGRIQELVASHAQRLAVATNVFSTALTAAFNAVVLVLTAFVISPIVALLMGCGAIVLYAALKPIRLAVKQAARKQARLASVLSASTGELTHSVRDIRIFGVAVAVRSVIDKQIGDISNAMIRAYFLARVSPGVYQYAAFGIVLLGLAFVARLDAADIGNVGAIIILLIRALSYGQRLSTAMQSAIESEPYVAEIRRELSRFQTGASVDGSVPLHEVESLSLRGVDFSYDTGPSVLRSVSFDVACGEVIGIVGPSGGGKSTLVQVLLRLHSPRAGEYLVNGRRAADYVDDDWTRQFALVPQENRLIRGTVTENVAFYRQVTAQVEDATRSAHVAREINALADGYNTVVGAGAPDLSGGQRQRLGLARALVGGPSVLVLDEPTSALDPVSEALVQDTLQAIRGQVTLLIVAHRISTLDICDRILVLEKGRVTAFGTPDEVRRSNGFFAAANRRAQPPSQDTG